MKSIIVILIIAVLLVSSGCIGQQAEGPGKLKVAVTILPQAEFVEKVGGDKVDLVVLVPPGASPHSYEPTPSQLVEVSESKLYFKVGSGVEFENAWMSDIEGVNPSMKVIDCSEGITLIPMKEHEEEHEHDEHEEEHEHIGLDPHIWNSAWNAKIMLQNIYKALAEEDPSNADYYKANMDSYLAELDELDNSIEQILEEKTNRKFIVFHPAWGYFAHDYDLEQIAIEEAGKEPTAQNLQYIIDEANENNIKVIFASPQFSTSSAETIAHEINGTVILINSLDKNYLENMQKVADAFEESMN